VSASRPAVSVALPCRNVAPWLPECIESLGSQSLRDFEVVAVNDGSQDETGSILRKWSARDGRVRVIELRDDEVTPSTDARLGGGLVRALNTAVRASRAPFLARMDGDDTARPQRLERQRELLSRRSDLAACGTAVELFPRDAMRGGYERYETWLNGLSRPADLARDLFVECPIAHPTLMIRRSVMWALGGYRDAGWPEDYDLVLRLHAAGMRAANLPDRLLRWRVRPDRHSLSAERYSAASFRRCKVHYLNHAFLPEGRPLVVWGAGRVGKALARELHSQGSRVAAFVDLDRRKIGQEIHGARVLDPAAFENWLSRDQPFVLAAVGSAGAREAIRESLQGMGRREIEDYRVCA